MPLAYYDGEFVEKESIKISPFDYGFARGVTVFEFVRLYGGVPFRLDAHIKRFMRGAEAMAIPQPLYPYEIQKAVTHLATENKFPHSTIKFYLTIGECPAHSAFGFKHCQDFTPHLMMIEEVINTKHPDAPRGKEVHDLGITLKTVPFTRQMPHVKSVNYAAGFVTARALVGTEYDEILYQHTDGYVTETTTSNFFCVLDGVLVTPGRDLLNGTVRDVLLELAQKSGIRVAEKDVTMDDLRRASTAFITNTSTEMLSVRKIDNITYLATTNDPVYAKLRQALTACIKAECES
jgi:branched-subunit amino acid aminotransferase/4-amino-4-deoxychorismate lyase